MRLLTAMISGLTCLMSGWMLVMYFILRHPGYLARAAMAAVICAGAATLLGGQPPRVLRIPVAAWGIALALLGGWALASPGDDGWALIAGALFVAEGLVAVSVTLIFREA